MILEKIAADTRLRVEEAKKRKPLERVREQALAMDLHTGFPFESMLRAPGIHYICEVKKASPSKGVITEEFPYVQIAREYEQAGAGAVSCLTEPRYFLGKDEYLEEIASQVKVPVLRKDFVIDDYMIYEAKVLGASAVLLICALLDTEVVRRYIRLCDTLGMTALVEVHDETEMQEAILAGARVIGVNNRNLKDFTVDIRNSIRLREKAPEEILFIAESGIQTAEDIEALRCTNVNGVLIGETLMRSDDKAGMLKMLNGGPVRPDRVKVKICGLKRMEDVDMVNQSLPDFAGFVFAQSRRMVDEDLACQFREKLDDRIPAAGVFVNDSIDRIKKICEKGIIQYIQLHGDEDEAYIKKLKQAVPHVPVIKAVRVRSGEQIMEAEKLPADYLLLDTYTEEMYGGSGKTFDQNMIPDLSKPFFLAGGIHAGNVRECLGNIRPFAVDVSSGVETDGNKNEKKIKCLIERVREHE